MMKSFVVFAVLLAVAFAHPLAEEESFSRAVHFRDIVLPGSRIISGSPAASGQFPWQAALYVTASGGTSFCGGALIHESWILTAAHCAYGVQSIVARLGLTNLNNLGGAVEVRVVQTFVHAAYNPSIIQNDIALLRLEGPVVSSSTIRPIPLSSNALGAGVGVTVSGWGRTSDTSNSISQTLQYVGLTSITNNECATTYGNLGNMIVCAKGATSQSTCNGDSGGALVTGSGNNAAHVGIVSFGRSDGCARGHPVGFTRTATFVAWIRSTAGI